MYIEIAHLKFLFRYLNNVFIFSIFKLFDSKAGLNEDYMHIKIFLLPALYLERYRYLMIFLNFLLPLKSYKKNYLEHVFFKLQILIIL